MEETKENEIVCTSSIYEINTWYIFRNDGKEVKVGMIDGQFKVSDRLTNLEIEYFNNNFR